MRAALLALALWPALALPARAGLYNTAEPAPKLVVEVAREEVLRMRSIAAEPPPGRRPDPSSLRVRYQQQAARLEAALKAGTLSLVERADLAACYLRLQPNRPEQAITLLRGVRGEHFLIHANLATAYFLAGDLQQATLHQRLLLSRRVWPSAWAGWSRQQLQWYHACEKAFLRLLELRALERRSNDPVDLDPLFPGAKALNRADAFRPGELPTEADEQLPERAVLIVEQLCVWLPFEPRLYWLLGELLNGAGQVEQAYGIFNELLTDVNERGEVTWGRRNNFRNLRAHQQALKPLQPLALAFRRETANWGTLLTLGLCLPRLTPMPGPAGVAAYLGSAFSPLVVSAALNDRQGFAPGDQPRPDAATPPLPDEAQLNWRHIGASFGFGVLATLLIGLQLREWLRRRSPVRPVTTTGPTNGKVPTAGPQGQGITTTPPPGRPAAPS